MPGWAARLAIRSGVGSTVTALPTERIWTPTSRPLLRLITCGGSFDHATGHYRENLIVYAAPTGN
jgi:hypothetical protein